MCGVVSVLALGGDLDDGSRQDLARANARMRLRGPDSSGEWFSDCGCVGMGHRRLAIVDLSTAGNQPMADVSGRYVIAFNGEIYNYRLLRNELSALGCAFASDSDTEVLMNAYATWGSACLPRLRGMFAFVIWDKQDKMLFAARDGFGIKPLYMRRVGNHFWLASQVKAIAQLGGNLTRDSVARAGFLLWGHVPEPHTPFCEIRAVPVGHYVEVHDGQSGEVVAKRWFDLSETMAVAIERGSDPLTRKEDLTLAMRDTVAAHRIADVPVGVFLSAGLDSTTLAALMCESADDAGPVQSVTLAFREYAGTAADEAPLAEAAARAFNMRHNTVWISRTDFEGELDALFDAMDQPTIDGPTRTS